MTLCELATANHSPPLECVSLTDDTELAERPRLPLNVCVEYVYRVSTAYMRAVGPDEVVVSIGPFPEVPSIGPAILATSEKSVSALVGFPVAAS